MKIVGLAGGSGTGKSTVAAHLVEHGAGLVDADRIAHELLEDERLRAAIRERFGEGVIKGGRVDRSALGEIVFGDRESREALNAIVHPSVLEACRRKLAEFESQGVELAVVDAALLLEVEVPFELDLVIALRVSREVQIERLLAKGGATLDEIVARLDSQSDLERTLDRADIVIDTGRPVADVLADVDRVIGGLLSRGDDTRRR
jgi:dephospho-CoA kinase